MSHQGKKFSYLLGFKICHFQRMKLVYKQFLLFAWNETNKIAGLGCVLQALRFVAEGLALREAVAKCRDFGLTKIRCDCAQLIKGLTSDHPLAELYGD